MSRRPGPHPARRGFSLVETVVSLTLSFFVIHIGWLALERQARSHRAVGRSLLELEAVRTSAALMSLELTASLPFEDWTNHPPDSVALRAFRGFRFVCRELVESRPDAELPVYGVGLRSPDPAKDSVLVLHGDGRWRSHDLIRVSASDEVCPRAPGRRVERWTVDPAAPTAWVVQYFERGSYHLAGRAFRYRAGRGGRQPLTPELFDEEWSGLFPATDGTRLILHRLKAPNPDDPIANTVVRARRRAP